MCSYERKSRPKYIIPDGKKMRFANRRTCACVMIREQPGGYVISWTDTRATLIRRSSARGTLPLGAHRFFSFPLSDASPSSDGSNT